MSSPVYRSETFLHEKGRCMSTAASSHSDLIINLTEELLSLYSIYMKTYFHILSTLAFAFLVTACTQSTTPKETLVGGIQYPVCSNNIGTCNCAQVSDQCTALGETFAVDASCNAQFCSSAVGYCGADCGPGNWCSNGVCQACAGTVDYQKNSQGYYFNTCTPAAPVSYPVAQAGPDQTVAGNVLVTLDGSKSSDPSGLALTYNWTQTSGQSVTLSDATDRPTFTTPNLLQPVTAVSSVLTFQLTVTNSAGNTSAPSTVLITVIPNDPRDGSCSGKSQYYCAIKCNNGFYSNNYCSHGDNPVCSDICTNECVNYGGCQESCEKYHNSDFKDNCAY